MHMSESEKNAIEIFKNRAEVVVHQPPAQLSFAERALREALWIWSRLLIRDLCFLHLMTAKDYFWRLNTSGVIDDRRSYQCSWNTTSILNVKNDLWSGKDIMNLPELPFAILLQILRIFAIIHP